jgi:hypothetical protein
MGTKTKIVTHADIEMGTGIFSNCGYEEGDYSTLPIPYLFPFLVQNTTIYNGNPKKK